SLGLCPEPLAEPREVPRLGRKIAERYSAGRRKPPAERTPQPAEVVSRRNQGKRSRDNCLTPSITDEAVAISITVHPRYNHTLTLSRDEQHFSRPRLALHSHARTLRHPHVRRVCQSLVV